MGDSFKIEVPCDDDGFICLQCPQCGEMFKLKPSDYSADDVMEVCCPSCGIVSENYMTDDVMELAMTILKNHVLSTLHKEMKTLERKTRGFKAGKPPKPDNEPVLQVPVNDLVVDTCKYCGRQSKISPLLSMSVFVCPFCKESNFNER